MHWRACLWAAAETESRQAPWPADLHTTWSNASVANSHLIFLVQSSLLAQHWKGGIDDSAPMWIASSQAVCPSADVRTWAFNPPGGLVSRNLNRVMDTFCTSMVVGKDAVSRGTVNNLSRLMDEMVTALARCRCDVVCTAFMPITISATVVQATVLCYTLESHQGASCQKPLDTVESCFRLLHVWCHNMFSSYTIHPSSLGTEGMTHVTLHVLCCT